ncbi:MAG: hypothetical protein ACI9HI_001067 [Salinirussus sp.]
MTGQETRSVAQNRVGLVPVVSGGITTLALGAAFGLLALGVELFWVAFPVGFGGVLPIVSGLVALTPTAE